MINISAKGDKLIVRADYMPNLVTISKHFGGSFNYDTKEWEIPANKSKYYLKELSKVYYFNISKDLFIKYKLKPPVEKTHFISKYDYSKKIRHLNIKPWEHQIEAFNFLVERQSAIIALPPGTGKTLIPIMIATIDPDMMYVCPATAKVQIAREFKKYAGIDCTIVYPKKNREYSAKGVIIVNYELFQRDAKYIPQRNTIVLDEAHKIKAPRVKKRTQKIYPISQAVLDYIDRGVKHVIALTGTPIISNLADTVNIMKAIGKLDVSNYWGWRNKYAVTNKFGTVIGLKANVKEYVKSLYYYTYLRKKEEIIDIPEMFINHVVVTPTFDEMSFYLEMRRAFLSETEDPKNRIKFKLDNYFLRARQAAISPYLITKKKMKSSKIEWIKEFLNDFEEKHLIIYSFFTTALDLVEENLKKKFTLYRIDGNVPVKGRQGILDTWKDTGGILLASDAIQLELNMQWCHNLILLNIPLTWKDFDQLVSRIYRGGQKEKTFVHILYMDETIDERLWGIVTNKNLMSDSILNNLTYILLSRLI